METNQRESNARDYTFSSPLSSPIDTIQMSFSVAVTLHFVVLTFELF